MKIKKLKCKTLSGAQCAIELLRFHITFFGYVRVNTYYAMMGKYEYQNDEGDMYGWRGDSKPVIIPVNNEYQVWFTLDPIKLNMEAFNEQIKRFI